MDLPTFLIQLLNSVQYGLLLFMLAAGLTLIFGIMGVVNLAHGSFYMLGAYLAYSLSGLFGSLALALMVGTVLAVAFGLTLEDMELILHPMVEDAKEAVGSMGDDSPLAVLSDGYRGLHHFFRQNFSQVTNPPIDSLRERRVMTLKTRLGNLGNILEEDESQTRVLQLESPVLTTAEYRAMRGYMGATAKEIDCTFDPAAGDIGLRDALRRIRQEAEDGVRGGAEHIILTDEAISGARAAIPPRFAIDRVW